MVRFGTARINRAEDIANWLVWTLKGFLQYKKNCQRVAKVPQLGMHASSYGLALLLHARQPFEIVITGMESDPQAAALEQAANSVYRFGKAVLRVTPERMASGESLAPALAETLPHLRADVAQALVSVDTTCRPPASIPPRSMFC